MEPARRRSAASKGRPWSARHRWRQPEAPVINRMKT